MDNIRNITVSGRIATGTSTFARGLSTQLQWKHIDGGQLFRNLSNEIGLDINKSNSRPDHFDLEYEDHIKKILREESHTIVQSHLAGYDAQGIPEVFKILLVCEDEQGRDKTDVRIDRLLNRDGVTVGEAKEEIKTREHEHLEKFRRLYANSDPNWVYWDKKFYDLVINTYELNKQEAVEVALEQLRKQGIE